MTRLVVVQTAFLGDVVLTTPLLRELRRANPGARISVVATPVGAEALRGHPAVDEIHVLDKKGRDRGPLALFRIAGKVRGAGAAVAAQRSFRTGLLLRLAGARRRVGFEGAAGAWAYTDEVPWKATEHAVRRYLELAGPLGGDPDVADPRPELAVLDGSRDRVAGLLEAERIPREARVVAVAPGSIWGTKRWLPEGFAEVIRGAAGRGTTPILVGSAGERALCEEIGGAAGVRPAILAGRLPIPELAALLERAEALVTNDSGSGHVASAVGTPVVSIFGPTVPAFGYSPFGKENRIVERAGLECRPCHHHGPERCPLGHFRCMREIEAKDVLEALDAVIAASRGRARSGSDGQR